MNSKIQAFSLLAVAMMVGGAAQAQQSTLKGGITYYQTHAKTTGVTGIGVPAGADARVGNATTALLTYEYEVAPSIGVELVLGIPPKIKSYGAGSVAFLGEVIEARNAAPTVLVNYHFGQKGDTIRPYAGLGLNYTRFVGTKSPYGYDVHLSDSWGPTAQLGLDYSYDKTWGAYASVAVVKVKSDLVAIGATVLQTTIDFRPVVYSVGVSYRF